MQEELERERKAKEEVRGLAVGVHMCVTSVYVCPPVGCDWTAGHSGEIKDIHS